jgi:uncharacterized MnhB-related membrane protein
MTKQKRIVLLSIAIIACTIIALLGALSLYGSMTRTETQSVLVNGHPYPNADIAGIAVLIGNGVSALALIPTDPVAAVPALSAVHREALFNSVILTSAVTAIAAVGAILSICLLAGGLRKSATDPFAPKKHE